MQNNLLILINAKSSNLATIKIFVIVKPDLSFYCLRIQFNWQTGVRSTRAAKEQTTTKLFSEQLLASS